MGIKNMDVMGIQSAEPKSLQSVKECTKLDHKQKDSEVKMWLRIDHIQEKLFNLEQHVRRIDYKKFPKLTLNYRQNLGKPRKR